MLFRSQRTEDGALAFFARPSPQQARRRFAIEQDLRRDLEKYRLAGYDLAILCRLRIGEAGESWVK